MILRWCKAILPK